MCFAHATSQGVRPSRALPLPVALRACGTFEAPAPLESVRWSSQRDALDVIVSADESAILPDLSGPAPCDYVYDAALSKTESLSGIGEWGLARSGNPALHVDVLEVEILAPPDMNQVHDIDDDEQLDRNSLVLADPNADQWIVVNQDFRDGVHIVDQTSGAVARTHVVIACSGRDSEGADGTTRIAGYQIDDDALTPVASTDADASVGPSEVAVMPTRPAVPLACGRRGLLAWNYGTPDPSIIP